MQRTSRKIIRRIALVLPVAAIAAASYYVVRRQHSRSLVNAYYHGPTVKPDENSGTGGIEVPFSIMQNTVYVPASFGGDYHECVLDSGSVLATFPVDWASGGEDVYDPTVIAEPFGTPHPAQVEIFPVVRLPGCTLSDCPAVVFKRLPGDLYWGDCGLLPVSAFRQGVVILDFHRLQLTFLPERAPRDEKLDTPAPRAGLAKPLWLPMIRSYDSGMGPYPVIQGTLGGQPARLLIDTGFPGGIWVFHPRMISALQLKMNQRSASRSIISNRNVRNRQDVRWGFGPFTGTSIVYVHEKDKYGAFDASLGMDILKNYRIILDYPGNRVCFERYLDQYEKTD